jgi:prepilin-type N-terminal cleavage/methylation domain-containing protein
MHSARFLDRRGFSLNELLLTVAVAATLMGMGVPVFMNITEGSKLSAATRELEREFQAARLRSVSSNRVLRVRLNCPATGYYRTVEFLNSAADAASTRCSPGDYPFPADNDVMTRPNQDGPVRTLVNGATVASQVFEFHPSGMAYVVVNNVTQNITAPITVTVTRQGKSKAITINATGKIQLQ